jgi:hypothetical protein
MSFHRLAALDVPVQRTSDSITALEPIAGFRAVVSIAQRIAQIRWSRRHTTGRAASTDPAPGRPEFSGRER